MFPLLHLQLEIQGQGQAFSALNRDLEQQKKDQIIIVFKEPHKSQKKGMQCALGKKKGPFAQLHPCPHTHIQTQHITQPTQSLH